MGSKERDVDVISRVLAQVDGVIGRDVSDEIMAEVVGQEIPAVVLRSAGAGPVDAGVSEGAHVNDGEVGALALEELERLSVKHWGFVGYEGVRWSIDRGEKLMNQRVNVHEIALEEAEREGWQGVFRLVEWLQDLPKPIGVFACSDAAGVSVVQACEFLGLKVPSQVAVIGVDNDVRLCQSCSPPLSSIDLHAAGVGKRAAWQMASLLGLAVGEEPRIGEPRLVARESSHDVDRYFLYYRKALEWLTDHALRGPSVEEVAEVAGVSRRGLERAFGKHANESPATVVREYRMKAIEKLLAREALSLDRVASQAGFADSAGLSNFVRRYKGLSPRDLRAVLLGTDTKPVD